MPPAETSGAFVLTPLFTTSTLYCITPLTEKNQTKDKDEKEILNYHNALSYAETLSNENKLPSIRDFCDLQKLVTADLIQKNQHGRLRTIPVSIVNHTTGAEIEKCPDPNQVPFLMEELWSWLKENENTNTFARAFAFHYLAVAIHPFADGNGRTVRLFQQILLLQGGESIARYVPSETIVMRNRNHYYAAIRQCKSPTKHSSYDGVHGSMLCNRCQRSC